MILAEVAASRALATSMCGLLIGTTPVARVAGVEASFSMKYVSTGGQPYMRVFLTPVGGNDWPCAADVAALGSLLFPPAQLTV